MPCSLPPPAPLPPPHTEFSLGSDNRTYLQCLCSLLLSGIFLYKAILCLVWHWIFFFFKQDPPCPSPKWNLGHFVSVWRFPVVRLRCKALQAITLCWDGVTSRGVTSGGLLDGGRFHYLECCPVSPLYNEHLFFFFPLRLLSGLSGETSLRYKILLVFKISPQISVEWWLSDAVVWAQAPVFCTGL